VREMNAFIPCISSENHGMPFIPPPVKNCAYGGRGGII